MSTAFKARWKRFRSHFWWSLLFDVTLICGIFIALNGWQTRDLPIDQVAPHTVLATLNGSGLQPAAASGQVGIVYFFAPWCFYCRSSIGNLQDLVDDGHVKWGTVVALDYIDEQEVQLFIDKTGVTMPVLMGTGLTASDWGIKGFPTYFVIDSEGLIASRSVGYSTQLGMFLRNWRAK